MCAFSFGHKIFLNQNDFCVLYFTSWIYNQGLTILSLHNMIILHFTSLSFVVYVV